VHFIKTLGELQEGVCIFFNGIPIAVVGASLCAKKFYQKMPALTPLVAVAGITQAPDSRRRSAEIGDIFTSQGHANRLDDIVTVLMRWRYGPDLFYMRHSQKFRLFQV
jgi:hypothetical protein